MLLRTLILLLFMCTLTIGGIIPVWKNLLLHYKEWKGSITHNGEISNCMLEVHSVYFDNDGIALVAFSAENFYVEMAATSVDNKTVIFTEDVTWHKQAQFQNDTNLKVVGMFLPAEENYYFLGNVSSDTFDSLGVVKLSPSGYPLVIDREYNTHLKYGLVVGIPVAMGVTITVIAAVIMWWAIKKGYLRHVPWAYKNFTNPRKTQATYKVDLENDDTPSVHI
ncbi:uncharacterized protein LOC131940649 [Physella acuta]|uniref:uncharacterized protein LOC131940649 n=1 Tax=Physella acuta TaxID=109671 RepID=UPI0027DC5EC0|nr:uncharacterized protein LOC131940649 [Physella acuta]